MFGRGKDLTKQPETRNLLSAVDDFDIEIAQTRQNEKLMALLEERARQTHTLPLDEVKRRLGIAE